MKEVTHTAVPSDTPSAMGRHRQRSQGRSVCCALMVALLTACSSFTKQPATPELVGQLRAQPVAQTVGDPKFRFLTGQDGFKYAVVSVFTGGILGAVVLNDSAVTKGKELSELGGLTDPGRKVADVLARRMKSTLQVGRVEPVGVSESGELSQILQAAPGAAAFVVDVRTGAWGGSYLPSQWNRYRLAYSLKARLIDRARKTVVAEGYCDYRDRSEANPPSYEDVIADRAALIRQRMDAYAAECADEVWAQMFPATSLQAPAVPVGKPAQAVAIALPQQLPTVAPLPTASTLVPDAAAPAAKAPDARQLSPQAEQRYQVYLSKPNPKAFAVSDNGGSWMAWGESLNPMVKESLAQRALRGCEERSQTRCVLYAVDSKVVYGQGLEPKR